MPVTGGRPTTAGSSGLALTRAEADLLYPTPENVLDHGAIGNGIADDTDAIQDAIDAAAVNGGEVYFPPGTYLVTALDLNDTVGVKLTGAGGMHPAGVFTAGAMIQSNLTNSASVISARGASGLVMEDLSITHLSGSFTGRVLDLRASASSSTRYVNIRRCNIGGDSGVESSVAVDLDGAILTHFENCRFLFYDVGVSGALSTGYDYAVAISFVACSFGRGNTAHVRNGGEKWTFHGCDFGNMTGGEGGAFRGHTGAHRPKGMSWVACWFGDATAGTRPQIAVNGDAFAIMGCVFGIWAGSAVQFTVNDIQGLVFQGNRVQGNGGGYVIDVNSTTSHGSMVWGPVSYAGIADVILGTPPLGTVFYDATGHNVKATTLHEGPSSEDALTWKNAADETVLTFNQSNDNVYLYDAAAASLRWRMGPALLLASGVTSKIGTETSNQFEIHTNNARRAYWTSGGTFVQDGIIIGTNYIELPEVSAPSAPAADTARLFIRDNGSDKTQACVRFPTGAVQVIATEP